MYICKFCKLSMMWVFLALNYSDLDRRKRRQRMTSKPHPCHPWHQRYWTNFCFSFLISRGTFLVVYRWNGSKISYFLFFGGHLQQEQQGTRWKQLQQAYFYRIEPLEPFEFISKLDTKNVHVAVTSSFLI